MTDTQKVRTAQEPELANDLLPGGYARYDRCGDCNYDNHYCPGCGTPLSHNGLERIGDFWYAHTGCTDE